MIEITDIDVTDEAPQAVTITWSSTQGATYKVEWSNNLVDWNGLADNIVSSGEETSAKDADIPGDVDRRFYRVRQSND